jgi:hypothetical protein
VRAARDFLPLEVGIEEPEIDAHVVALKPAHPYLRPPLQSSAALESRLLERLSGLAPVWTIFTKSAKAV